MKSDGSTCEAIRIDHDFVAFLSINTGAEVGMKVNEYWCLAGWRESFDPQLVPHVRELR